MTVKHIPLVVAVLATGLLSGCADSLPSLPKLGDLNPFAEKQVPLPGKRVPIMAEGNKVGGELATADRPIGLPALVANEAWSQPGGSASNAPGHLALNASIKTVWTGDAGQGSSKYGKLSASPIVYGGKVFTLDAAGQVTAFSISGGGAAWRASVAPDGEKNPQKGYGGGLAADGGRVYAATGFGTVVALDAASGKKLWEKSSACRSAPRRPLRPTACSWSRPKAKCIASRAPMAAKAGPIAGLPEKASFISNASPAVDGDTVVVPFTSGDVVALKISTGQALWTESLARTRTASSMAAMSDAAPPCAGWRLRVRDRPCRPHGCDQCPHRRTPVVADGAEHRSSRGSPATPFSSLILAAS